MESKYMTRMYWKKGLGPAHYKDDGSYLANTVDCSALLSVSYMNGQEEVQPTP